VRHSDSVIVERVMQLQSYYWKGATVAAADREAMGRLFDIRLPVDQRREALAALLSSDSVVARGIALDFYCISNANLRFGDEPMIDDTIDAAVRASAIRELERPPYERTEAEASLAVVPTMRAPWGCCRITQIQQTPRCSRASCARTMMS
jgi:hypothetical protein